MGDPDRKRAYIASNGRVTGEGEDAYEIAVVNSEMTIETTLSDVVEA